MIKSQILVYRRKNVADGSMTRRICLKESMDIQSAKSRHCGLLWAYDLFLQ